MLNWKSVVLALRPPQLSWLGIKPHAPRAMQGALPSEGHASGLSLVVCAASQRSPYRERHLWMSRGPSTIGQAGSSGLLTS